LVVGKHESINGAGIFGYSHTQKRVLFRELIEAGNFRQVVDRSQQLHQIVEDYKYDEMGRKSGNVAIAVGFG
jgi:hypothetical protein